MADERTEMFQENDARKEGDPVADEDCKGTRIDAKKGRTVR